MPFEFLVFIGQLLFIRFCVINKTSIEKNKKLNDKFDPCLSEGFSLFEGFVLKKLYFF